MDPGHRRSNPRLTDVDGSYRQVMERPADLEQRSKDREAWRLVDVLLSGGAPWGFTLRGGREHREPLLITKVEEGSKAAAVSLQVGDELVNINDYPLSGYRQEAICLVKGSYKTLTLVVKRRNEPVSRPHSWHATKFNESQSETAKTQSPPPPVWHTRYDASSSSTDLSTGWEQTNLRRVSDQFSSLGSMDSLEHVPHPYPSGRLSPAKSNTSAEHLGGGGGGGGKRDSAYSSFSTSSGTPDYTLSKSNAASTENVLYKVSQWDAGGRPTNGRHSQILSEGAKADERAGYLQLPGGPAGRESPRPEEQPPGPRPSNSGRANFGPVWHVPEKKKPVHSPSPPPPLPPVRSDSFAATKVHEKGLVIAYPEDPDPHLHPKAPGTEASDTRRGYSLSAKIDAGGPPVSPDSYHHNQLNSNKPYSLSSTDVRLGPPPYAYTPYHQRQYSDESTFYSQPRTPSAAKPHNISAYYSSMQELPTNNFTQTYVHTQTQTRASATSLSSTAIDQNPDGAGHTRYYCVTARQPASQAPVGKTEDGGRGACVETVSSGGERAPLSPQTLQKTKYQLPQPQPAHPTTKDSNGYGQQDEAAPRHKLPSVPAPPAGPEGPGGDDRGSQRRLDVQNADTHYMSYPPSRQPDQRRSLPTQHREPDVRPGGGHQGVGISPQTTPLLHSLSAESAGRGDTAPDPLTVQQTRRSERFATTLRSEIQMRRAKLQKSKSAAALSGTSEAAEEETAEAESQENSVASPSSEGSFSSTYKDHLKEAQARVLKATSFRRRDLEPVLLEHSGSDGPPGYPSSVLGRKDSNPLPSVSEAPPSRSGGGQVTRIGGRKRFTTERKVRSYSEPDKIHEVGVDEAAAVAPCERAASMTDRRKLFETTGKPAFPKPLLKPGPQSSSEAPREPQARAPAPSKYPEEARGLEVSSSHRQALLEQQRLGTFAEYEATWSLPKKPAETRASGRYRSADNILDPAAEERTKPTCVHERSRSSPSADFYGQNIPVPGRKSAEHCQPELQPAAQNHKVSRSSSRNHGDGRAPERPADPDRFPEPPVTAPSPEHRLSAAPGPGCHRPADSALPGSEPSGEPPAGPRRRAPAPLRPPPPRLDRPRCPESAPLLGKSQEALTACSPSRELNPAPVAAAPSPRSLSEQSRGLPENKRGGDNSVAPSNPQPAPPPPPSLSGPSGQAKPSMDGQRSPSPQFAPQRLTDKPPVSLQDENSTRTENVMENSSSPSARKVPIKIVHSESLTEKESRHYLLHSDAQAGPQAPGAPSQVGSLGAPDQSYSLFCAYSRQRDPGPQAEGEPDPPPALHADLRLHIDSDTSPEIEQQAAAGFPMAPPTDVAPPASHLPAPPTTEALPPETPGSNGVAPASLSQDDQKREELARDIMGKDRSLAEVLDQSRMKTTMDLMEGIFPQEQQLLEGAHQRRKVGPKQASPRAAEDRNGEDEAATAVALVTSSTYYSTSAPKAELLIKMKDMQQQEEEPGSEDELPDDDQELADKKELIDSLSRKLQVLREARESVQEDVLDNNALGREVEATVQQACRPNELDKFRMFVGDLDKVVSLLLSLSGRLARVENALNSLEGDAPAEERRTLTDKRKLLIRQHEDAKELKDNLDRREGVVYDILAGCLPEESLADYQHFVKMKSALIIEQRKLEDKIKLGEEQLKCLTDSLPLEQRLAL
ncbi:protein Shroom2 isoform X2 [Hypomesus transpacificus]|uniref:protein Shroom2 isoform X2 n=1 Tax=Hypomesus transpacificus TaxID=137520 RepID=UPI001F076B20|nr:protein Shroom2 isoform X2 [Hypomesus transpacificus]